MIDRVKYKDTQVSRLGLGTMRLPCTDGKKFESSDAIDFDKASKIVDTAIENGINYFDTAYMYHEGKSENFIGKALKKYPRESFFLADKLPIWMCDSPEDMERVFSDQLKKCDVDYFDFYLLHALDGENYDKCEKFKAYEFVSRKRDEGKIRNIGFSFHGTTEDLKRIVGDHHWDFAQIQMNYLDWKIQSADEQYRILTDAGIPVIVMEPVRGGKLAMPGKEAEELLKSAKPDKSIASWAINFVASYSNVLTILSGMNSLEQLYDNIENLTDFKPFTDEEFEICRQAASLINKQELIGCTGCDYCSDCPRGVKISSIFSVYNKYKSCDIGWNEAMEQYKNIDVGYDICVSCGKCKSH
ncbi:MAG: aldo/keto reductase, partial [Eubacterium sp.]